MDRFYIQGVCVDPTRGEITSGGDIRTVEPKAMAVLVYLADHANTVVSQEALYNAVWPRGVFNPGVLQRCIAQLRKALSDDAKNPVFIKTHPKRGYSLEAVPESRLPSRSKIWLPAFVIAVIVLLLIIGSTQQPDAPAFTGRINAETSSDSYDFYPVYTSDEKSLAFIRQPAGGGSEIVLLNRQSGTETVLLSGDADYQGLAWSADNLTLFYLIRDDAGDVIGKVDIVTGQAVALYQHDQAMSVWRIFPAGNVLYFMAENVPLNRAPETVLYELDLVTRAIAPVLHSSDSFTPYRFALTADGKQFAIAGESEKNTVEFRLFDIAESELSEPFATLPLGFTEINWYDEEQLVVHHLNKLYLLSLEGEFTKLPLDGFMRIFNPVAAPQSGHISMTVTEQDSDLITMILQTKEVQRVIDSASEDHAGRFSPDGQSLAYVSARSGVQQVMITESGKTRHIFDNPDNLPVYRAPVWDNMGQRLAFSQGQDLMIFDSGTETLQTIAMPDWFTSVLDWYSDGERLLLATKQNNQSWFEIYDLQSGQSQRIAQTGVYYFARLDANDKLVFSADETVYWGGNRFQHPSFTSSNGRYFPSGDQLIYQADHTVYAFDGEQVSVVLDKLPPDAQQLVDVNDNQLLFQTDVVPKARIATLQ